MQCPGRMTMSTKTVDVIEAKEHLTELLSLVLTGTEITLTQDGAPLARIVPLEPAVAPADTPRVAGLHAGSMWTSDDFDDPLPEDFWTGSE
jgi:prevent-host-death family protein